MVEGDVLKMKIVVVFIEGDDEMTAKALMALEGISGFAKELLKDFKSPKMPKMPGMDEKKKPKVKEMKKDDDWLNAPKDE